MPKPLSPSAPIPIINRRDDGGKATEVALSPLSWPRLCGDGSSLPTNGQKKDCFQLLQSIVDENEQRRRKEHDKMVKSMPRLYASSGTDRDIPSIFVKRSGTNTEGTNANNRFPLQTPEKKDQKTTQLLRRSQSVRFASGPPKVYRHNSQST